jgi:hypothetical protein
MAMIRGAECCSVHGLDGDTGKALMNNANKMVKVVGDTSPPDNGGSEAGRLQLLR